MSQPPRVIHCKLMDCYYYKNYPEGAIEPSSGGLCLCTHPNNDLIVEYTACQYYRMDWSKKLKGIPKKPLPGYGPK